MSCDSDSGLHTRRQAIVVSDGAMRGKSVKDGKQSMFIYQGVVSKI